MHHRMLAILGVGLALSFTVVLGKDADPGPYARAHALVERLREPNAPGGVVGVLNLNDGTWIFQEAFGLAHLKHGIPNTLDTVFGVASVTKQFTAAATAIAAHQGYFSLDDDIRRYVPEMPAFARPITIRNLVQHTSGLRDDGWLMQLTGKAERYATQKDLIRLFARQRATNFPPGEDYRYSNAAYVLLAELIGRTTGKGLADYAENNLFRPLGMAHTYYITAPREGLSVAQPYERNAAGEWKMNGGFTPQRAGPGGMMTTLNDYALWAINLIAPESKLAGGAALTHMLRSPLKLKDGSTRPYGFGLWVDPYRGAEAIKHGGSGNGYKAYAMILPGQGIGIFGFCNNGRYADAMVMALADIYLTAAPESRVAAKESTIRLRRPQLEALAGIYRSTALGLPMIVKPNDLGLMVSGGVQESQFEPLSPMRFRNAENTLLEFSPNALRGTVRMQRSEAPEINGTFQRIKVTAPRPQQLSTYAGDYHSAELDAVYRITVEDGRLTARIVDGENGAKTYVFEPMLSDEFASVNDRISLRFTRDQARAIRGFFLTAQFGWVTGVAFQRVPPPSPAVSISAFP